MSLELKQYVKEALGKGATDEQLSQTLAGAGWSPGVVQKTLDQFVGVDASGVPIPAPRMQAHQVARDLFLYLLALITLGMSALALGGLLFDLINRFLPDPVGRNYTSSHSINWAIAQIAVAFPVYLLINRWIGQDLDKHLEKRESFIRKLSIYLILILTALTGLGDLVVVFYKFLEGEMTLRFIARAGVVLGISAMVFIYYFSEVRRDDQLIKGVRAERSKAS